ncbi:MAG: sulfatase family protein, partial [Cellulosilyticaceae bacterium]
TLGETFASQGWKCIHFGKEHDYGGLRGFECVPATQIKKEPEYPAWTYAYESYYDEDTTGKVIEFIQSEEQQPWLAVADLHNPHNICMWIGENIGEHIDQVIPEGFELPELPDNFEFEDIENRPEFISFMCCAHRRQRHAVGWNRENYKHYLAAYYYYIHLVDRQIGMILEALEQKGILDNTLIMLFADHGEGMGAHGLVTKYGTFYEETNRVPLIVRGPQVQKREQPIGGVVSLLDIMPTVIEYAGLIPPEGMEGQSLLGCIQGQTNQVERPYVVGEWYDEFDGYRIPGRMVRGERYKYTCYQDHKGEELYDMVADRLEKTNLIHHEAYQEIVSTYRQYLKEHTERTQDNFFELESCYSKAYRQHEVGFEKHQGYSAVENYFRS